MPLPTWGKIAAGFAAGVLFATTFLWQRYVVAPPPEVVCGHVVQLSQAAAGEAKLDATATTALINQLEGQCVRHKQDKIRLRGRVAYARHAKCVMAASDLHTLERC